MAESVLVAQIPDCDLCRMEGRQRPAAVDGKTTAGPWANMCESCFAAFGIGLGTGRGQRLVLRAM